jgi:ABC-type bacteriocin/lantibiotic exporter with double-glycine peptidase domain
MQSTQLSLIIKKLTEFYGTTFDHFAYHSPLSENKKYSSENISDFVNDLIEAARKQQFLVVENYASKSDFEGLVSKNNHPVVFFEKNQIIIAGRLLKNNKPFFYKIDENQNIDEISEITTYKPLTVENDPDATRNGKVRFLTIFPLENISDTPPAEHLSPLKRLFGMLRNERKDIINIYIYAVVVGIMSLSLPLGIQAIIGLVSGGLAFSSVYVLIGVVIIGVIISGPLLNLLIEFLG